MADDISFDFNTTETRRQVGLLEKSLDNLFETIKKVDTVSLDKARRELEQIGKSSSVGLQNLSKNVQSEFDKVQSIVQTAQGRFSLGQVRALQAAQASIANSLGESRATLNVHLIEMGQNAKAVYARNLHELETMGQEAAAKVYKGLASSAPRLTPDQENIRELNRYASAVETIAQKIQRSRDRLADEGGKRYLGPVSWRIFEPDRMLSSAMHKDNELIQKELSSYYANLEKASALKLQIQERLSTGSVGAVRAASPRMTMENREQQYAEAMSAMRSHYTNLGAVPSPFNDLPKTLDNVAEKSKAVSTAFKGLTVDSNDAHAAVRGLASGFGAMWLTYGRIIPLMAGAAVSGLTKRVFDIGSDVEYNIKAMEVLGMSTGGVRLAIQTMAEKSMFSMREMSEAMVRLGQSGLNVKESLQVLQPAAELATAGMVDLKTSTDLLLQVNSLFGLSAGDTTKTAAKLFEVTKAGVLNVENLKGSFKAASETNTRFGKSLEETLAIYGVLAKAGIKDSAGGTAAVNFLRDMSIRSGEAGKAVKTLEDTVNKVRAAGEKPWKFSMFNADKSQKTAVEGFRELNEQLQKLDPEKADELLAKIGSDRGLRTFFSIVREGTAAIDEMVNKLKNVKGDETFLAANGMLDTVKGAAAQLRSAFEKSMDMVFDTNATSFKTFILDIRDAINSPEFVLGVNQMVTSIKQLYDILTLVYPAAKLFLEVWVGYKVLQMGTVAVQGLAAAISMLPRSMTQATLAAQTMGAVSLGTASALNSTATMAAAAGGGLGLLGTAVRFLANPIVGVITTLGVLGATWYATRDAARTSLGETTDEVLRSGKVNVAQFQLEIDKLRVLQGLRNAPASPYKVLDDNIVSAQTELANLKAQAAKPTRTGVVGATEEAIASKRAARIVTLEAEINQKLKALDRARTKDAVEEQEARMKAERKAQEEQDRLKGTLTTPDMSAPKGKSELEKAQDKAKALTKTAAEYAAAANAETESVNALTEVEKKRVKTMTDVALLRAEYLSSSPAVQAAIRKETDKAMELANAALEDDKVRQARDSRVKSAKEMAEILEKARSSSRAFWEKDTNAQAKTAETNALNLALVNMTRAQKASATAINEANAQFATGMEPLTKLLEEAQSKLDTLYSTAAKKDVGQSGTPNFDAASQEALIVEATIARLRIEINTYKELAAAKAAARGNAAEAAVIREDLQKSTVDFAAGAKNALTDYLDNTTDVAGDTKNAFKKAFSGMEDAIVSFTKTGKFSVSDMATSIISDLIRIQIQQSITRPLGNALASFMPSFFGPSSPAAAQPAGLTLQSSPMISSLIPSAKGNVFQSPGLSAYSGQIVNTPTTFAFAKGGGLMGEAGPEAIMPLTRAANGKLGVQSTGGSSNVQVIVNNNSTNTQIDKKESTDSRGNRSVELTISDMVAGEVRRSGSSVHNAVRGTFGASPKLVGR